jgi:hypothetical protein
MDLWIFSRVTNARWGLVDTARQVIDTHVEPSFLCLNGIL